MCGIVGTWRFGGRDFDPDFAVRRMAAEISHRGPDADGFWSDPGRGLTLGHRRLSIVDLSPLGSQPMLSASGRFVTVFNGEIYNFRELRAELERGGIAFRGHSDTEVMLAALERWGLDATLERLVGMFAFALFDRQRGELHLVRDRIGEKPLYVGRFGDTMAFASELKALRRHPLWNGTIDRGSLALLLRHNYVPAPYSIYEEVRKVLPGTYLTVSGPNTPRETVYWSALDVAKPASWGDEDALVDELDSALRRTISEQMVADVPVGAFLSGGIDSSLIVGVMQALSPTPIQTFTIGFHEQDYDEAGYAKRVAEHLGTRHTELYVTPQEALAVVPRLPTLYDEPFADVSQIPTFLVSQLARRTVTVSLSGDGGDELFGGYNRYFLAERAWRRLRSVPLAGRRAAARAIRAVPTDRWDSIFHHTRGILPSRLRVAAPGDKAHKFASILEADSLEHVYRRLVSHWTNPNAVVIGGSERPTRLSTRSTWPTDLDPVHWMMFMDLVSYLPDDIMVKVDRAAMGVSLESRAPFLDHRIVEFAWRLPLRLKVHGGTGKWILRRLLERYVPTALIDRPKMGFGVPIEHWLRGPLRDWAASLLDARRLADTGFFDVAAIRSKWEEHTRGVHNWHYLLWDVLMFEAWREQAAAA